jgi:hypothetical protein
VTPRTIPGEIARVNAGRRVRTIDMGDVIQALQEALRPDQYGYGFTSGGRVANAYGNKATTACVYAIQFVPGRIAVRFGSIDAHKGSSETTWATGCSKRDIEGQRNYFAPRTDRGPIDNGWIYLSVARAKKLIRMREANTPAAVAVDIPPELADVILTREASIAAGNCESQTDRVAQLVGKPEAKASDVARVCIEHGCQNLLPYVVRAARFAALEVL